MGETHQRPLCIPLCLCSPTNICLPKIWFSSHVNCLPPHWSPKPLLQHLLFLASSWFFRWGFQPLPLSFPWSLSFDFPLLICLMLIFFFSAVQHGDQITLTCIHFFFPPFVLLRSKYLDIILSATQQDLIINPFQIASDNSKLPIPPTPSLSPRGSHKSILEVHRKENHGLGEEICVSC